MVTKLVVADPTSGGISDADLPVPLRAANINPVIAKANAAVTPTQLTQATSGIVKLPAGLAPAGIFNSTSVNDARPGGALNTYSVIWLTTYSTQPSNFIAGDLWFILPTAP